MSKEIRSGAITAGEIFDVASLDLNSAILTDPGDGRDSYLDFRRVRIGGLPIDSIDSVIHIPVTADSVVITIDGKAEREIIVKLTRDEQKARAYSFETAAEASDLKESNG